MTKSGFALIVALVVAVIGIAGWGVYSSTPRLEAPITDVSAELAKSVPHASVSIEDKHMVISFCAGNMQISIGGELEYVPMREIQFRRTGAPRYTDGCASYDQIGGGATAQSLASVTAKWISEAVPNIEKDGIKASLPSTTAGNDPVTWALVYVAGEPFRVHDSSLTLDPDIIDAILATFGAIAVVVVMVVVIGAILAFFLGL